MFNIILLLILLVFVVALQAAYPPASANTQPFTGLELLTGAVSTTSASVHVPGAAPSLALSLHPCIPAVVMPQSLPSHSRGPGTTSAVGAAGGAWCYPSPGLCVPAGWHRCARLGREPRAPARSPWAPSCTFPQGYFTHSLLYYGYYSNTTLNDPCASSPNGSTCPLAAPPLPYNMPLAYLFSVGVSFLVTCILLAYRWVGSASGTASLSPVPSPDALTPSLSLQHVPLLW